MAAKRLERSQTISGWLMAAPALIHLFLFALFPIGVTLLLSFFDWNLLKGSRPFVGLENYQRVFTNEGFWKAMGNSGIYTLFSVPLGMALALIIALMLAKWTKAAPFFRTLYYLPAISSQVAIAMVWIYVYLPERGLINSALALVGLPSNTDFLNQMGWAMAALVFMSIWTGLGPKVVLFGAGLLNIPEPLYEAAELDGASDRTVFWKITLPLLAPTTLFVMVTSVLGAMQLFTPVYLMTKGGPLDSTSMAGYFIYSEAWVSFRLGTASAQSVLLFAVLMAVSVIQWKMMNRRVDGWGNG
jgi:multiple sugar transport system permease protein